jgi:hypothetical protein
MIFLSISRYRPLPAAATSLQQFLCTMCEKIKIGTETYLIISEHRRGSLPALTRVRFPAGAGNFSLHYRIQSGSGAHPTSYPMGTRGSFPGSKVAG